MANMLILNLHRDTRSVTHDWAPTREKKSDKTKSALRKLRPLALIAGIWRLP